MKLISRYDAWLAEKVDEEMRRDDEYDDGGYPDLQELQDREG